MTPVAKEIARALLAHHQRACRPLGVTPDAQLTKEEIDRCTIFYSTLCEQAGCEDLTRIAGNFLDEIARWCSEQSPQYPPLNALAVSKEDGMPGPGYDGAGDNYCHLREWPTQVTRCIAFTQYPSPDCALLP